jgi:hypothetical protein
MNHTLKRTIIVGTALTLLLAPSAVFAKDGVTHAEDTPTTSPSASPTTSPEVDSHQRELAERTLEQKLDAAKTIRQAQVEDVKATLKAKLDDTSKKACENHSATINRLMTVMDKRRENAFATITKISDAVQKFYIEKQLSVSNYAALVAAVDAAKAAAQTATSAQTAIPQLDCSGEHPRADVSNFKSKRADSIDAMKAYRDAVKALVQAVKSSADQVKGTTDA